MKLIKRIYNRQFNWIDLVPGNWQWELFLCVCMYVVIKSFQTDTVSARIPVASDNKKNPSVQPRNSLSHVNWENLDFNFRYSKTGLKKHIIKLWFSPYLHSVDSILGLYMVWSEAPLDIILTITDLRGATLLSVGIKIHKIQKKKRKRKEKKKILVPHWWLWRWKMEPWTKEGGWFLEALCLRNSRKIAEQYWE